MKDNSKILLSTRPLDRALVEKAAFQHIIIDNISFIEIKSLVSSFVDERIKLLSKQKATVVFTSMNAVETVVALLPVDPKMPDWNIYCIGGATFTLVKKYWPYEKVAYTAANATELANRIAADQVEKSVFFCGNKRLEDLPTILSEKQIAVEELVVYQTIETPVVIDRQYDGIMFFSPSAVKSFFISNQLGTETVCFAIGNTTAKAIKQFCSNNIIVSDFPARDQLVDKAIKFFSGEKISGSM